MKNIAFHHMIFLILSFCLINKSYQVFYILDPLETRCISKLIPSNSTFSGSFYISGEFELNNNAAIKNNEGVVLWKQNGRSNGSFNLAIEHEGKIYLI
jgi:hypothetical protein